MVLSRVVDKLELLEVTPSTMLTSEVVISSTVVKIVLLVLSIGLSDDVLVISTDAVVLSIFLLLVVSLPFVVTFVVTSVVILSVVMSVVDSTVAGFDI